MNFESAMLAAGLIPKDIIADGKFYRCATTDKPRKKNGAYVMQISGTRGYFINYALDDGWNEWKDSRPMTPIQRRQSEQEQRAFRQREQQRRLTAIRSMRAYFDSLRPLRFGHPYLEAKGLQMLGCNGLKVDGELLVIPMMRSGSIVSLQTITPAGEKKYRYGCPTKGASFALTRLGAVVTCLAEGFATGLAVYQSLPNANVIICFDAGNMTAVAAEMKLRGMVVVCADNDWETEQRTGANTGILKGRAAAQSFGCGVAYPEGIAGSDWADFLLEWAEDGARKMRMEIMRHARPVF